MASAKDTCPNRRSRRIAGLEPPKSSPGTLTNGQNGRVTRSRAASASGASGLSQVSSTSPFRSQIRSRGSSARTRNRTLFDPRNSRASIEDEMSLTTSISDSSSQNSDVPALVLVQGTSSTSATDEPSTSSGRRSVTMGTAFGSNRAVDLDASEGAVIGGQGQEQQPRRSRRNRFAQERAIIAACRGVPASAPVKGESYCECQKQGRDLTCTCGEEDNVYEWIWDPSNKSAACDLSEDQRTCMFHASYSSGTAAVRGTQPMTDRQYFWEVKMTSPVYGTDMMVGVGTENVNLGSYRHAFTSLLGRDGESWGLSYYGRRQHKAVFDDIKGAKFGQGTILGVYVDMWHGTLSFYKNRRPLGIAYSGLQGKQLYPMVASTAARTAMKVIKARSFPSSLQFFCCQVLRRLVPSEQSVIEALNFPPGLKQFLENNLSWLLRPSELAADTKPKRNFQRKRGMPSSDLSDADSDEDDDDESPSSSGLGASSQPPPKRLCVEVESNSEDEEEEDDENVGAP